MLTPSPGYETILLTLRHTLQVMHDHPDLMTDLGSHLCTQWSTLVLVHVSLMTESIKSCSIRDYGSPPLAACTHLHTSSAGLHSMSLSDLTMSIGHLTYSLVPI